jgi:hypothetical protein
MSDGFAAGDLDRVATLVGGGATGLSDLAGSAPGVPDAGRSSAAVAGVLHALSGVAGRVVTTADTASAYVRGGHQAYHAVDAEWAGTFDSVGGAR